MADRQTEIRNEIQAALSAQDTVPREKVLAWIESAADLPTLAELYELTGEGYCRIQPELGGATTSALIQRYLLECIRQNVSEDIADTEEIQGRWEAAQSLHAWFCHLAERKDSAEVLTGAACAVTELFLTSGQDVRDAIEQGFLEHALEMESLRPYFEYWSRDARLRETWSRALAWGEAHPNFTWGLLQDLRRKIQSE